MMTRGERAAIKQYVSDILELDNVQLEIRNGRVFSIVKEDLGDLETIIQEAWAWSFAGPEPEYIHF